jgi:hypothetical protein
MRNIDAMVADHDHDQPDRLADAGVVSGHGAKVRTTWPEGPVNRWRPSDRREFQHWVRVLYVEEGLGSGAVAERMNANRHRVERDISELGIRRTDGKVGKGTAKAAARDRRRAEVKRIYDERNGKIGAPEIARLLGASVSTINYDMQALGINTAGRRVVPGLDQIVSRTVQQLHDLGDYLLNHPELHLLVADAEQVALWRKQLSTASKGVNRVRKYLNNQGENQ